MSVAIELRATPMDDDRRLVEVIKGGEVIALAPYSIGEAGSLARCIQQLIAIAPALENEQLEARILESESVRKGITPTPLSDLVAQNPEMREPLIDGILRRGETCNIIAASKVGKSFLAAGLAWSVATGRDWLFHRVTKCKVLVIDNELHPETLADRLKTIADTMGIEESERNEIHTVTLRGLGINVDSVGRGISIPEGEYGLVIVDALYRWLPPKCSENDNGDMMHVYNRIDELAARWGAAVVIVHHSSKGDQSEKAVTDVGAGAGAISRAADTHLTIRPHDDPALCVLEAVTRSWPRPDPISIRYSYPIWELDEAVPALKPRRVSGEVKQGKKDADGKEEILRMIPDEKPIGTRELRNLVGMGEERMRRLLGQLTQEGIVAFSKKKKKGANRAIEVVSRIPAEVGTEIGTEEVRTI